MRIFCEILGSDGTRNQVTALQYDDKGSRLLQKVHKHCWNQLYHTLKIIIPIYGTIRIWLTPHRDWESGYIRGWDRPVLLYRSC